MDTDPNWLPSTTVQSSAVLVAVIGGMLVTRLVSLSTEAGELRRRLDEHQTAVRLLEGRLADADRNGSR